MKADFRSTMPAASLADIFDDTAVNYKSGRDLIITELMTKEFFLPACLLTLPDWYVQPILTLAGPHISAWEIAAEASDWTVHFHWPLASSVYHTAKRVGLSCRHRIHSKELFVIPKVWFGESAAGKKPLIWTPSPATN